MLNLLLKDWRASKLYCLIIVPWAVLFATQFYFGQGYIEFYLLLAVGLILLPLIVDAVHDTEETICSLPVSRAKIVRARYLSAFVTGLIVLVLGMVQVSLLTKWLGNASAGAGLLLTATGAPAFLLVLFLTVISFFPCYFFSGLARGAFTTVILLTSSAIVVHLALPTLLVEASTEGGILMAIASRFSRAIEAGQFLFPLLLGLICLVLVVASMRLSEVFYRRRDL